VIGKALERNVEFQHEVICGEEGNTDCMGGYEKANENKN